MWKLFFINEIRSKPCTYPISTLFLAWAYFGDKQKGAGLELVAFPSTVIPNASPHTCRGAVASLRGSLCMSTALCLSSLFTFPRELVLKRADIFGISKKNRPDVKDRTIAILLGLRKLRNIKVSKFSNAS